MGLKKVLFAFALFAILILLSFVSAARLPTVGGDSDGWGTVLNDYLNSSLGENATSLNISSGNLTLGQKITFALGGVIDNLITGLITFNGDIEVQGNIISSGVNWTAHSSSEANQWFEVAYGNGKFVAVANSGTHRVMTSPDGVNWDAQNASVNSGWVSIAYGDGVFVAVASDGINNRVMHSDDGINWNNASATEQVQWQSVTYGNGKFVAVADSGTNRTMYSTDGKTWTSAPASKTGTWYEVIYGNGKFVAVGTGVSMYSTDGINWYNSSINANNNWNGVIYGNGLFVAVAAEGTNRVMYSTDGITWYNATASDEGSTWSDVTYGDGLFVATAYSGTSNIMTSTNGINWTNRSVPEQNFWLGITYGNGVFVTVSLDGTNQVMTSGRIKENVFDDENIQIADKIFLGDINFSGVIYGNGSGLTDIGSVSYEFGSNNFNGSGNFTTTGRIGIGTTNPTSDLYINGSDPAITLKANSDFKQSNINLKGSRDATGAEIAEIRAYNFRSGSDVEVAGIAFFPGSTGTLSGEIAFNTKSNSSSLSEIIRIDENGRVGIGTTNPVNTLDVVGDLNVTGNVTANYESSDGSPGITDTSSYWLCSAVDCSTTCQVQIKDGLITGCI